MISILRHLWLLDLAKGVRVSKVTTGGVPFFAAEVRAYMIR